MPTKEIWENCACSSSSDRPSSRATSASVGVRRCSASSLAYAFSMALALARTDRGTQSMLRSSSMMAPLTRVMAYVSNLMARSMVELLDGVDQPEDPVADEVGLLDRVGQAD